MKKLILLDLEHIYLYSAFHSLTKIFVCLFSLLKVFTSEIKTLKINIKLPDISCHKRCLLFIPQQKSYIGKMLMHN